MTYKKIYYKQCIYQIQNGFKHGNALMWLIFYKDIE
jgi:hypothetical protein